jgi:hypothetical protein
MPVLCIIYYGFEFGIAAMATTSLTLTVIYLVAIAVQHLFGKA